MALVPEENIRLISDTFFFSSDIGKTIKGKEDKKEFGVNCKQMKRLKDTIGYNFDVCDDLNGAYDVFYDAGFVIVNDCYVIQGIIVYAVIC